MLWLILLLPSPQPHTYDVDVLEKNVIVGYDGSHQATYWLYWSHGFSYRSGYGMYIKDWRAKDAVPEPVGHVQEWQDHRTQKRLRVRHRVYRVRVSLEDREVADRDRMPDQERRKFGE